MPHDVDELVMPAVQTYDDGKSVAWDEPQTPGGQEPEHPAPVLTLVASASAAGTGAHNAQGEVTATPGATVGSNDNTARWLAGAGLLAGALGLAAGLSRRRFAKAQTDVYRLTPEPRRSPERARHHSRR